MGGYGEFDGVLLEAFKRPRIQGTLQGRALPRLGRRVGNRPRRPGDREQLRLRVECHVDRRRFGDSRRRAVLARVPAPRRRRRNRRAGQGHAPAARRSPACLQPRRLSDRRHGVGRVSALREVPDALRLRPAQHRAGHGLRRDVRQRDVVAALRGYRRTPRQHRHPEEHRRRDGCGLRRLGRQLLVQRRRRRGSRSSRSSASRFRARRCRAGCSSTRRAPARSTSRATTSSWPSTTSLPATRASGSSPAGSTCAAIS